MNHRSADPEGIAMSNSKLSVTLIDVGHGDSILLEFQNGDDSVYGLVDSNDTKYLSSSYIYLKRFFEKRNKRFPKDSPAFEFVILSHDHQDHKQGLIETMRVFGTKRLWYPASNPGVILGNLLSYANHPRSKVGHVQVVDTHCILPDYWDIKMQLLWPNAGCISSDPNDNSIVLLLTLGKISFLLTGDIGEAAWASITPAIPRNTRFIKVPHHGAKNSVIGANGVAPWLTKCTRWTRLGISCHVRPHSHPHPDAIQEIENRRLKYYRTDIHHHITAETDGSQVWYTYSH